MGLHPLKQANYNKEDTRYNEPVRGGKLIPEGTHDVRIVEINDNKEQPYLDVRFENADGQTLNERIYLVEYQSNDLSVRFVNFVRAVVGTAKKADETIDAIIDNPSLLQAFAGLKMQIKVVEGKYGYSIEKQGSEELRVVDAGDGSFTDLLEEEFGDQTFTSFKEVREAIKTVNEANKTDPDKKWIKAAFPKVYLFLRPEEGIEENVSAIQSAISALTSPAGNGSNPKSTDHLKRLASQAK